VDVGGQGMKYTNEILQGSSKGTNQQRLWARLSGGDVIIADFGVSQSLRDETKAENARRARAAWNFSNGTSTEQLETMLKRECDLDDLLRLFVRVTSKLATHEDGALVDEAQALLRCIGHTEFFQQPKGK
jgi:hypothetical protein